MIGCVKNALSLAASLQAAASEGLAAMTTTTEVKDLAAPGAMLAEKPAPGAVLAEGLLQLHLAPRPVPVGVAERHVEEPPRVRQHWFALT